jgi:hypothetical protein
MLETQFDTSLVIHTGSGRVRLDDILASMQTWFADSNFDPEVPVLWDLRDCVVDAGPEALAQWGETMLSATNENRAGHKTAWVLPTSDIAQAAVDLLSSHDFRNKVRIYQNDRDAAEAWLTTTIR